MNGPVTLKVAHHLTNGVELHNQVTTILIGQLQISQLHHGLQVVFKKYYYLIIILNSIEIYEP